MVRQSNVPFMKVTLTHRNHAPSKSIAEMLDKELKSLHPVLQISEARVHLERSLTDSPPFSASLHLVTPGPDVIASSTDHTLRAAILKAFQSVADTLEQRHGKSSHRSTQSKR
jgi:ribosome-associated translation inhibitor RaiA